MDRRIYLWDVERGELARPPFEAHRQGVMSLAFSRNGRYLVSGGLDETVAVWSLAAAPSAALSYRRFYPLVDEVAALACSPDGQTLAIAGRTGSLVFWDFSQPWRGRARALPDGGQKAPLLSIAFDPQGRLASGSGRKIALWSSAAGPRLDRRFDLGLEQVRSAAANPEGWQLAAAGRDPVGGAALVRIFDGREPRLLQEIAGLGQDPALAFAPGGGGLLVAHPDRQVSRVALPGGRVAETWTAGAAGEGRRRSRFFADGSLLAGGGRDGMLELWDTASRRRHGPRLPMPGEAAVASLEFGPGRWK